MNRKNPLRRAKNSGYSIRKQKPTLHKLNDDLQPPPPSSPLSSNLRSKARNDSDPRDIGTSIADGTYPARKRIASELLGGFEWTKEQIRLLPKYSVRLDTGALSEKLDVCTQLRMILTPKMCDPPIPPYQQVFAAGIPQKLLALMTIDDEKHGTTPDSKRMIMEMRTECATSILLVLLSRNPGYIQYLLDMRVVEVSTWVMKGLLSRSDGGAEELQRILLWCVGLVSSYSSQLREYVLREGCLQIVTATLSKSPKSLDLYRQCVWTLKTLCGTANGHSIGFSTIWATLSTLQNVFSQTNDIYVVRDASSILLAISRTGEISNVAIIEAGLLPIIVSYLKHPNVSIRICMLEIIGNMVMCSEGDDIVQAVIDAQALPVLTALFSSPERELAAESLWVMSNITAGSDAQIDSAIKSGALSMAISIILSTREVYRVKKEAGFVLLNAVLCSKSKEVYARTKSVPQFIPALEVLLGFPSPDILVVCLDCLLKVCKVLRGTPVFREIKQSRIPQVVLDIHTASKVSPITDRTSKVMDKYFDDDNDEDDEDDYGKSEMNVESCSGSSSNNTSDDDDSDKDMDDSDDGGGGYFFNG